MNGSFITLEMKALIGKETVFTAPEEIGRASIRLFAMAIGDSHPLYWDGEFAERTSFKGIIAPPTFICETSQYMTGEIDERGGFARSVRLPLPGVVRGGNEYEFFQPVRPTDVVSAKWKVTDIYEKEGKTGNLVFLICEITYSNQNGEVLAINRETMIFRPRTQ